CAPGRNRLSRERDPGRRDARAGNPRRLLLLLVRGTTGAGAHGAGRRGGHLPTARLRLHAPHPSPTPCQRGHRLAGTRATGRSFDDRVGSAAQLLALRRLDRAALKHQVIFIWSVREEIGLEGAEAAAATLGMMPRRVYAIDTFVS